MNANPKLLVMTVDISPFSTAKLDVHLNDDPQILAKEFCSKHSLQEEAIPVLFENIKKNMEDAIQEKLNESQALTENQNMIEEQNSRSMASAASTYRKSRKQESLKSSKHFIEKSPLKKENVFDRLYSSVFRNN